MLTPIKQQRREIERAEIKRMFAKYDAMDAERLKRYNRISMFQMWHNLNKIEVK